MAERDWAKALPRSIRSRLDGIGNYVSAVLDEERIKGRLTRQDLEGIQIAAFVFSLEEFLREGSMAAAQASDAFAELGVEGFSIGREYFSKRNEAVVRGDMLADQLVREVGDVAVMPRGVNRPQSLRALVVALAKERARVRRMDRGR